MTENKAVKIQNIFWSSTLWIFLFIRKKSWYLLSITNILIIHSGFPCSEEKRVGISSLLLWYFNFFLSLSSLLSLYIPLGIKILPSLGKPLGLITLPTTLVLSSPNIFFGEGESLSLTLWTEALIWRKKICTLVGLTWSRKSLHHYLGSNAPIVF